MNPHVGLAAFACFFGGMLFSGGMAATLNWIAQRPTARRREPQVAELFWNLPDLAYFSCGVAGLHRKLPLTPLAPGINCVNVDTGDLGMMGAKVRVWRRST